MTARDVLDGIRVRAKAYVEHGTPGRAAPQDRAILSVALDAVLAFHKPIESGHPQILDPVCEGCSDVDELHFTFHPCETVEAIENAIKESQ